MGSVTSPGDRSVIILAGGEGARLRPLTRSITGDERPKQFCPFLDGETLLERTRRRVAWSIRRDRTSLVLTRSHARFYAPLLSDAPAGSLVVQPWGRGTAPAILYGLLRASEGGPSSAVAVVPSDHYVSDDAAFMTHVDAAFDAAEARPDRVVLLGIEPNAPEGQYGWIEPGALELDDPSYPVYGVRRFWEKPETALAERLLGQGCLWNSFVLVARVPAWLGLFRTAVPALYDAFAAAWARRAAEGEDQAMRALYANLVPVDFSEAVLGHCPARLAVLPVRGLTWSDWGDPTRVLRTLAQLGRRAPWAEPLSPASPVSPVSKVAAAGRRRR